MADLVSGAQQEIAQRLRELEPAVTEYERLTEAEAVLARLDGAAPTKRRRGRPPRAKANGRTTSSSSRKPKDRRAGRRKGTGKRAAEALAAVEAQPGITIPELVTKMGIQQNYLYRLMPGLQKEGKVSKRDRGWHPRS